MDVHGQTESRSRRKMPLASILDLLLLPSCLVFPTLANLSSHSGYGSCSLSQLLPAPTHWFPALGVGSPEKLWNHRACPCLLGPITADSNLQVWEEVESCVSWIPPVILMSRFREYLKYVIHSLLHTPEPTVRSASCRCLININEWSNWRKRILTSLYMCTKDSITSFDFHNHFGRQRIKWVSWSPFGWGWQVKGLPQGLSPRPFPRGLVRGAELRREKGIPTSTT